MFDFETSMDRPFVELLYNNPVVSVTIQQSLLTYLASYLILSCSAESHVSVGGVLHQPSCSLLCFDSLRNLWFWLLL